MRHVHRADGVDGDGTPPAPDERYVYMREEDRSIWIRASYLIDKYKLLWAPGVAIFLAAGFGWRTPAQTTHEIRASIDTTRIVLQRQVDTLRSNVQSAEMTRGRLEAKLDVLLKLSCSNPGIPRHDKVLAGLSCESDR